MRIDGELRHYVVGARSMRLRAGAFTLREMTLGSPNMQASK